MVSGTANFKSDVKCIEFEAFEITPLAGTSINKIVISCHEIDGLLLAFHIQSATNEAEAIQQSSAEAERIVNRIAFEFSLKASSVIGFGPPRSTGHSFSGSLAHSTDLFISGKWTAESADTDAVRQKLKQPLGTDSSYLPLFRDALNASDPASQFLGMYQILVLINNDPDDQQVIEQTINKYATKSVAPKAKPPRKGKTPKPGKPPVMESVYSRLRNEYMHDRNGTSQTLASTRAEMTANLRELVHIVKEAIEKGA